MGYIEGISISICINIVCVCGIAILTGYMGLFSMGHACFLCLGAYTAACLTKYLGVNYYLALLAGGAVAGIASLVIGIPTLRGKISSDCFTIATLGFGEAVRILISTVGTSILGGATGLSGLKQYTTLTSSIVIAVLAIFLTRNYAKSQHGRIALAIRDHADASELLGVNIFREKLKALVISAFFCGVGGGMMAHYYVYIVPNIFGGTMSNNLLTSVVLGGVSSITGPSIATAVLTAMPEAFRFLANWRLTIYGLVLIAIMRLRPEGLFAYKEIFTPFVKLFGLIRRRIREKRNQKGTC